MRSVTSLLAFFGLFVIMPLPAEGGDKIKIEIVEATTTIQTLNSGQLHMMFDAKSILPDGSHAALLCLAGDDGCAGIAPLVPEKSSPPECTTRGAVYTCIGRNLGFYEAKRNKNDLVIYGPKGKLRYHIASSW
jgi:hypothetical protein